MQGAVGWEVQLQELKEAASNIRTGREILRIALGQKYSQNFLSREDTVKDDLEAKRKSNSDKKHRRPPPTMKNH